MQKIINNTFLKISFVVFVTIFFDVAGVQATTLLDWTGGNGTSLPGWAYFSSQPTMNQANTAGFSSVQLNGDAANLYAPPGFYRLPSAGGINTERSWMPRLKVKDDHDNPITSASIDTNNHAPCSSTIPTFKVSTTSGGKVVMWWYSFPDNFKTLGYSDDLTDRMDFYIKFSDLPNAALGTSDPDNSNVHIGTYNCWGGTCPVEYSGFHDYHYLTANPGAWMHVQLNQHPEWMRDTARPINDPTNAEYPGNHYFATMNSFYIESPYPSNGYPSYWLGNINLEQSSQAENEEIGTLWVGYWPGSSYWEVGFNDNSFGEGNYNDNAVSKHEIRWSTVPITNTNWSSANTIVPQFYRFDSTNSFRRPNPWKSVAWTRFTLPIGTETNNDKIYFAIKDTSLIADGDGHSASSYSGGSDIRTIDYTLRVNASPETYSISDFTVLVSNWLHVGVGVGDINLDSNVNTKDLGVMMSKWN